MDDASLIAARLDVLYERAADGSLIASREWERKTPPLLHAVLSSERLPVDWAVRQDVPARVRDGVDSRLSAWRDGGAEPGDALVTALQPAGATRSWGGPAARRAKSNGVAGGAVEAATAALLEAHMPDWVPDLPHRHPFLVAVSEGRAVAVRASVRDAHGIHEAGVETVRRARRRGHAASVVSAWAAAVIALGAQPVYTTSWDNTASLALAARCGFTTFAEDLCIE